MYLAHEAHAEKEAQSGGEEGVEEVEEGSATWEDEGDPNRFHRGHIELAGEQRLGLAVAAQRHATSQESLTFDTTTRATRQNTRLVGQ